MENSKASYFKNRLFDEKKRLLKVLNNMNNMEEYGSMDNYYSELSQYDNHPADIATEVFMKEQDEGLKNNLMGKLHEIGDSLDDINYIKEKIIPISKEYETIQKQNADMILSFENSFEKSYDIIKNKIFEKLI